MMSKTPNFLTKTSCLFSKIRYASMVLYFYDHSFEVNQIHNGKTKKERNSMSYVPSLIWSNRLTTSNYLLISPPKI